LWPPNSPDLNPLDFSIWSYIQTRACNKKHSTIEALKKSIRREWAQMPEAYIRKVCSRFRPRIEAVIAAEGGHIE
jgi:hypothetical protein